MYDPKKTHYKTDLSKKYPGKVEAAKKIAKKWFSRITDNGSEVVDPEPLYVKLGIAPDDPVDLRIEKLLSHSRFVEAARMAGYETPEEADDFSVPDGDDPLSAYELVEMAPEYLIQEFDGGSDAPSEASEDASGGEGIAPTSEVTQESNETP